MTQGGTNLLTPISNAKGLFLAGVEHGADDHETRRYRTLAHAQDKANSEEAAEALASSMGAKGYTPYEDVNTELCISFVKYRNVRIESPHPFSNGESLESEILRILEDEIADVEYCS